MSLDKKNEFDFDDGLKMAGEFGTYQCVIFVIVGLTACIPATIVYVR